MKRLLAAPALLLALSGCASYSKPGGDPMLAEYDRRDCAKAILSSKDYPTRADSFQPGGMERSAERIGALEAACMRDKGYKA